MKRPRNFPLFCTTKSPRFLSGLIGSGGAGGTMPNEVSDSFAAVVDQEVAKPTDD